MLSNHVGCRMALLAGFFLTLCGATGAGPALESWISSMDMSRCLAPQPPGEFQEGPSAGASTIRLDESKTYQTILGLGSSLEHSTCANLGRLAPDAREEVIERLFSPDKGIGINLSRICIGTPDFTGEPWYSYDDMPPGEKDLALEHFSIEKDRAYILPVLKLALQKNPALLFFASPWSPPGWMKTGDDMIGGHLYPRHYGVYAEYFVKFIQAYAKEGIPIHAVTVQNEPGVNKRDDVRSWWYPSCQWSLIVDEDTWWPVPKDIMGHAERDFIRDYLGPAFDKHGLTAKIWCFDHNFNNCWYPRNILSDKKAAQYVEGTAFHPYAGEPAAMGAFHDEFPKKDVFLTEGSTYGVRGAIKIMEFLRNWACVYNAWVTILDTAGKPNNGPFEADRTCVTIDAKDASVTYRFDYYMYGQFMKYIPRGAVRIDSGADTKDFGQIAFKNPDGSFVLVAANATDTPKAFTIAWRKMRFPAEIPAQSVATYRWRP